MGLIWCALNIGSWVHCGYHLTTSIVAPPLLSLPYAFTFLGWTAGILCLVIGALVTFYSYNLISLVLEHYAQLGHRHLRFRDMAHDILGKLFPTWIWMSNFNHAVIRVHNHHHAYPIIVSLDWVAFFSQFFNVLTFQKIFSFL